MMSDHPDDHSSGSGDKHQVGYGKPPKVRRFKKSGNPRGRPMGAKNRETIIRQVAQETHTVTEDGAETHRTTLEFVLLRLRNMALEGNNSRATAELHKLLEKYDPRPLHPDAGFLVVPAEISPEEWIAQAERRNALATKPNT